MAHTIFVVVTEWDGPGYRNPGDAPVSEIEGAAPTREAAERFAAEITARTHAEGHVSFARADAADELDSWEFDVKVVPCIVDDEPTSRLAPCVPKPGGDS